MSELRRESIRKAAEVPPSRRLRSASQDLFGRESQLETAFALAAVGPASFEEVLAEVGRRAANESLHPPKASAVRKGLAKLVDAGCATRLGEGPGVTQYFAPQAASAFWPFLLELAGLDTAKPGPVGTDSG